MTVKELLKFIEKKLGKLGNEEKLMYGNEKEEIKGITVCWMATKKVMEKAYKDKHNLIISHEDILFPPEYAWREKNTEGLVSEKRKNLLEKYKINVIRIHANADKHFIFRSFANSFGLKKPFIEDGIFIVYKIKPEKFESLCKKAKKVIKSPYIRVCGDNKKVVKKIGNLVGGLGLSINSGFINKILNYGVDMVIVGEFDEYTERALIDAGVCGIEIGHEKSEEMGMMEFADFLKKNIKGIGIKYIRNSFPWRVL